MKQLTDSGVVTARKDGSWMKYSLNTEKFELLSTMISNIYKPSEDCICRDLTTCSKDS